MHDMEHYKCAHAHGVMTVTRVALEDVIVIGGEQIARQDPGQFTHTPQALNILVLGTDTDCIYNLKISMYCIYCTCL